MTNYYKNDDLSFEPFTRAEEARLFELAANGDVEARNKIVENYLQFAASEGLKAARGQFPDDEVLSAANQGLLSAVTKFDWRRGNGFSCFARQFIRGRVGHLRRDKIKQSQREVSFGVRNSKQLRELSDREDGFKTRHDITFENCEHSVEHEAENKDWQAFWLGHVREFSKTLSEKQQRVIHCVIFEEQTFVQVAADMHVTPNTVRRLYASGIEALKKLCKRVQS